MTSSIKQAYQDAEVLPAPPTLAELLEEISATAKRYIWFQSIESEKSSYMYDVIALWVMHTYVFKRYMNTPYLNIWSPDMNSGKSTVLEFLQNLTHEPRKTASITVAAATRLVALKKPTLLLDEGDKQEKEVKFALQGIFNAGFNYNGTRILTSGKNHDLLELNVYCPKGFAGNGSHSIGDTLISRSISIRMWPLTGDQSVEPIDNRAIEFVLKPLKGKLGEWFSVEANVDSLPEYPEMPYGMESRAKDAWTVLVAIAEAAGGTWPEATKNYALKIQTGISETKSIKRTLLEDIYEVFQSQNHVPVISTAFIASSLADMHEQPWAEYKGKPFTAQNMAILLRDFGIKSMNADYGANRVKCYQLKDLLPIWKSFVPHIYEKAVQAVQVVPDPELPTSKSEVRTDSTDNTDYTDIKGEPDFSVDISHIEDE